MKKLLIIVSIVLSSAFCFVSCDDDDYKIPNITSDKCVLQTETYSGVEILSIYAKAHNAAGGINLNIPSEDGTDKEMFIKNEELETMLKTLLVMQPDLMVAIKKLNYINFLSNSNLIVSYNDDNGNEIIIPDMLKGDGSLVKSLKYRKSFDRIYPRLSERLSRFIGIPAFGELTEPYSFIYQNTDGGYFLRADKTTLNAYVVMLAGFEIDETIVSMITNILAQYKKIEDSIEIGFYLKKIE